MQFFALYILYVVIECIGLQLAILQLVCECIGHWLSNIMFQVKDKAELVQRLGCAADAKVKVVSIFGNTGDGKSYTLNQTFFKGDEVRPS